MPTYEYRCRNCAHYLETVQKMSESPLKICPNCNQEALARGPGGGIGFSFNSPSTPSPAPITSSEQSCCPCGKNKGSCGS